MISFYDGEEGSNMAFKDFMVWHVTEYEPAVILNLAQDWPALTEWDMQTEQGE